MANTIELGTVDPRVRRYVAPVRIVWQQATEGAGVEALLSEGSAGCVLKYGATAPAILLDFGRELHGGVIITNGPTPVQAPTRVRVRFGESVIEAMGEPNQDHAIHDQVVQIPWYGSTEIGNTGFRFVRIELVDPGTELHLKRVHAVFLYRDLPYLGSFKCSDERLNTIWQTGAYTVHLCMQEMLWDGIKRDRLVWIGDMHPETTTISMVFGDMDVVPASLDYVRDMTPLPGWMNGIGSYSLWWIRIQRSWYLHHGNRDYLAQQGTYLKGLVDLLLEQIGEDGRENIGGMRFMDWPSSEDPTAIHAGLQALLLLGLEDAAAIFEVLGEKDYVQRARDGAARLRQHKPEPTASKQANALLALAGIRDVKETNTQSLAKDPLQGVSTFYGYYVLQARAAAGDYAGCLEVIRKYWGAMLDLGATTFWEDFNLDWAKDGAPIDELVPEGKKSIHADYGAYCYKGLRHSLCHGWASGPTAWLSEHVLGVSPLEPGCARLSIKPHLADLDFAEGAYPTPHGLVRVRVEKGSPGGKPTVQVEAPPEVKLVY